MGFTTQDCRHARRRLLFWVHERPESDSESSNEEEEFLGYTREEIFFPEGSNTREFSENRGVNSASSSESDSSSDPGLKASKNRSRNPKRWKRNIRKRAKAEGMRYIMTSGKVQSPRKQGPPCSCPRKCFEQVSRDEREHLLMQFNHKGRHDLQNQYLRGLIVATDVKRRGSGGKLGSAKHQPGKKTSYAYYILTSINRRVQVCQKAFLSIHGIGYTRVKNIRTAPVCKQDMRGKHSNRVNKVTTTHVENVRNHIKSFPPMASYYSRKNNKKQFLKEGLNVHRMYDMYLEKYEPSVKEHERENLRARQEGGPLLPLLRPKVTYRRYLSLQ